MSLHEDVRRTDDVPIAAVEHPKWKDAHVRPMSAKALGQFQKMAAPEDGVQDDLPFAMTMHLTAFLAAHCLCDKDGVRVWKDDEVEWVETNKTAELLQPIAEAAAALHGLNVDAEDRAKN